MNTALIMDHVRVARGGAVIVPDLSMQVGQGEIVGLIGPSGSGKTTTIRAMLGLTRLAGGSISVLGHPAGSAILRGAVGYMPQGEGVYPDLSGRENLLFFAGIYRIPRARVEELLTLLDLATVAHRRVDSYSGGQRRRVGLAIALLHNPELLILDEPTVGLDPALRQHLWSHFRDWAHHGTTLIVSTHVMEEAAHCDRIAFLLDGQLATFSTPEELLTMTGTKDLDAAALALSERAVSHGA